MPNTPTPTRLPRPPQQLALPLPVPAELPQPLLDAWVRQQWMRNRWLQTHYSSPADVLADPERARRWRLCARQALLARQRRHARHRNP